MLDLKIFCTIQDFMHIVMDGKGHLKNLNEFDRGRKFNEAVVRFFI